MKRGIVLVLIGLLLVASLVGCNAYRRNVVTTPETHVTAPGVTRGNFRYRGDGQVVDGRTHRRTHRTHGHHNYRHDGRITDTDGIIGDGSHADRPPDGRHTTGRAADRLEDGARNTTGRVGGVRRMDGVTGPSVNRNDLVAR